MSESKYENGGGVPPPMYYDEDGEDGPARSRATPTMEKQQQESTDTDDNEDAILGSSYRTWVSQHHRSVVSQEGVLYDEDSGVNTEGDEPATTVETTQLPTKQEHSVSARDKLPPRGDQEGGGNLLKRSQSSDTATRSKAKKRVVKRKQRRIKKRSSSSKGSRSRSSGTAGSEKTSTDEHEDDDDMGMQTMNRRTGEEPSLSSRQRQQLQQRRIRSQTANTSSTVSQLRKTPHSQSQSANGKRLTASSSWKKLNNPVSADAKTNRETEPENDELAERLDTDRDKASTSREPSCDPKMEAIYQWINFDRPHHLQPHDFGVFHVLDEYCGGSAEPSHVIDVEESLWFGDGDNNESDRLGDENDDTLSDDEQSGKMTNKASASEKTHKPAVKIPHHIWHQAADRSGFGVASGRGNQAPLVLMGDACSGYSQTLLYWSYLRMLNTENTSDRRSVIELDRISRHMSSLDHQDQEDIMGISEDTGSHNDGTFDASHSRRHDLSKRKGKSSDKRECVIVHRCGAGREAAKLRTLFLRIIREISKFFRLNTNVDSSTPEDRLALQFNRILETVGRIAQTGGGVAAQTASSGSKQENSAQQGKSYRLIIVIDDAHLLRSSVFEPFQWMPLVTPTNVHIIMSSMCPSSLTQSYQSKASQFKGLFAPDDGSGKGNESSKSPSVLGRFGQHSKDDETNAECLSLELPVYSMKWGQWLPSEHTELPSAVLVSPKSTANAEQSMTFQRMQEEEVKSSGKRPAAKSAHALSTVREDDKEQEFAVDGLDPDDVWRQLMFESEERVIASDLLRRKCSALVLPSSSENYERLQSEKMFTNSRFFEHTSPDEVSYYQSGWKRVQVYLLEIFYNHEPELLESIPLESLEVPTDILDGLTGLWICQCYGSMHALKFLCEATVSRVMQSVDVRSFVSIALPWDDVRPMISRISVSLTERFRAYSSGSEHALSVDNHQVLVEDHITLATQACAEAIVEEWIRFTEDWVQKKSETESGAQNLLNTCKVRHAFDMLLWLLLVTREGITWKEFVSFLRREDFGKTDTEGIANSIPLSSFGIANFPLLGGEDERLLDLYVLPFVLQLLCRIFECDIFPLCINAGSLFESLLRGDQGMQNVKRLNGHVDFLMNCPTGHIFLRTAIWKRLALYVADEYDALREMHGMKSAGAANPDSEKNKMTNVAASTIGVTAVRSAWVSFLHQFVDAELHKSRRNVSTSSTHSAQLEASSHSAIENKSSTKRIARELQWQLQVLRDWRALESVLVDTHLFPDSWGTPKLQLELEEEIRKARSDKSHSSGHDENSLLGNEAGMRSSLDVIAGTVPAGQSLLALQLRWYAFKNLLNSTGLAPYGRQQGTTMLLREAVMGLVNSVETSFVSSDVGREDMVNAWCILTGTVRHPHLHPGGTVLNVRRKPANSANDLSRKLKILKRYAMKGKMACVPTSQDCLDSPYVGVSSGDLLLTSGHHGLYRALFEVADNQHSFATNSTNYYMRNVPEWSTVISMIRSVQFDEIQRGNVSEIQRESSSDFAVITEECDIPVLSNSRRKKRKSKSSKTSKQAKMDNLNNLSLLAASGENILHIHTHLKRYLARAMLATAATKIVMERTPTHVLERTESDSDETAGEEINVAFNTATDLPFGPSSQRKEILKVAEICSRRPPDLFSTFTAITALPSEIVMWVSALTPEGGGVSTTQAAGGKNKGLKVGKGTQKREPGTYTFRADPVMAYNKSIEAWSYRVYGGNAPIDIRTKLLSVAAEIMYQLGDVESRAEAEDLSLIKERLNKLSALEAAAASSEQNDSSSQVPQGKVNPKFAEYFASDSEDNANQSKVPSQLQPKLALPVDDVGNSTEPSDNTKISLILCAATHSGKIVREMFGSSEKDPDTGMRKLGDTPEKRRANITKKRLFYKNQLALSSTSRYSLRQCLWAGLRFLHRPVEHSRLKDVHVKSLLRMGIEPHKAETQDENSFLSISTVSSGYLFIRRWIWLQWPLFGVMFAKIKSEEGRRAPIARSVASLSRDLEDATTQWFEEYGSKTSSKEQLDEFKESVKHSSPTRQDIVEVRPRSGSSAVRTQRPYSPGQTTEAKDENASPTSDSTEEALMRKLKDLRGEYDSLKMNLNRLDEENSHLERQVRQVDDSATLQAEQILSHLRLLRDLEKKSFRYNAAINAETAVGHWYQHLLEEVQAVPAHDEMYFSELSNAINAARSKAKRMNEQATKVSFELEKMKGHDLQKASNRLQHAEDELRRVEDNMRQKRQHMYEEVRSHRDRLFRERQLQRRIKGDEDDKARKMREQKIRTAEAEARYAKLGLQFHASYFEMSNKVDHLRQRLNELNRTNANKLRAYNEWTTSLARISQLGGNAPPSKSTRVATPKRRRGTGSVCRRTAESTRAETRVSTAKTRNTLFDSADEEDSWTDLFRNRFNYFRSLKDDWEEAENKITDIREVQNNSSTSAKQGAAEYGLRTMTVKGLTDRLSTTSPEVKQSYKSHGHDSVAEEELEEATQVQRAWRHVREIREDAAESNRELHRYQEKVNYLFDSLHETEIGVSHILSLVNISAEAVKKFKLSPAKDSDDGVPQFSYQALSKIYDALEERIGQLIEYAAAAESKYVSSSVLDDPVAVERLELLIGYKESTVLRNICDHVKSAIYTVAPNSNVPEKIGNIQINNEAPSLKVADPQSPAFRLMACIIVLAWRGLPRAATFLRNVGYRKKALSLHDVCFTILASLPSKIWSRMFSILEVEERKSDDSRHKAITDVVEMAIRVISSPNHTEPPASSSYKKAREQSGSEAQQMSSVMPSRANGSFTKSGATPLMLNLSVDEETGYIHSGDLTKASSKSDIKVDDSGRAYQRRRSGEMEGLLDMEDNMDAKKSSKLLQQQLTKMRRGSGVDGLEGLASLKVFTREQDDQISPAPPESPTANSSENMFSKFFSGEDCSSDEDRGTTAEDAYGYTNFSEMYSKISSPIGRTVNVFQRESEKDRSRRNDMGYQRSRIQQANQASRRRLKKESHKLQLLNMAGEFTTGANANTAAVTMSGTAAQIVTSSSTVQTQPQSQTVNTSTSFRDLKGESKKPKSTFLEFHKLPTSELLEIQNKRQTEFVAKREMRRAKAKQSSGLHSSTNRSSVAAEAVRAVTEDAQLWDESFVGAGNPKLSNALASFGSNASVKDEPSNEKPRRTSMADVYAMGINDPDEGDEDDEDAMPPPRNHRRRSSNLGQSKSSARIHSTDRKKSSRVAHSGSLPALH